MLTFLSAAGPLLAAESTAELLPPEFWTGLLGSVAFGLIGIALAVLGFKVFDWVTPRMNVERELAEKHNVAVAIVMAAVILGICYIVAHVVH